MSKQLSKELFKEFIAKTTNIWSKRGDKLIKSNNKIWYKMYYKSEYKKIQEETFGTNTTKDNLTFKYL